MLEDPSSLYKLKEEDLLKVEKIQVKLAKKILKSIQLSLNPELALFLSALGITGGAINKCEKIIEEGNVLIPRVEASCREYAMYGDKELV